MKVFHLFFSTLLASCLGIATAQVEKVHVFTGSLSELDHQAAVQSKAFIYLCGKSSCTFTKATETQVFAYAPLAYYMNEHFLVKYCDLSLKEFEAISYKYHIEETPTYLVFEPSGRLNCRWDGFMTANELYDSLISISETYYAVENTMFQSSTRSVSLSPDEQMIAEEVERTDDGETEVPYHEDFLLTAPLETSSPALPREIVATTQTSVEPTVVTVDPIPTATVSPYTPAETESAPTLPAMKMLTESDFMEGLDAYVIKGFNQERPFGIMVGRFSSRETLDAKLAYYNRRWFTSNVRNNQLWVGFSREGQTPVYSIYLGSFETIEQAERWGEILTQGIGLDMVETVRLEDIR